MVKLTQLLMHVYDILCQTSFARTAARAPNPPVDFVPPRRQPNLSPEVAHGIQDVLLNAAPVDPEATEEQNLQQMYDKANAVMEKGGTHARRNHTDSLYF